MVKIRLSRIGAKGQPYYRVVAIDERKKRDGKFLEILGRYNPRTEPSSFEINEDRLKYWRGIGAQVTEAVLVLLKETEPKKHRPKNVKKEEEAPAEVLPTPVPAEGATEVKVDAPEETPEPSPELAKAIDASEKISPEATPEEIAETVENTTHSASDVLKAEILEPTTQEELVDEAETVEESDDETEKKAAK
jgi:small subunit ribosomal protein S16